MRKLAKILGMFVIIAIFSGCGNKTAAPATSSAPAGPTTISTENPADASEMPQIDSSDPNVQDLNNLANDIDDIDQSAQDLDENEDLSAE